MPGKAFPGGDGVRKSPVLGFNKKALEGNMKYPFARILATASLVLLALAGCSGDDGATGPQGPAGPQGPSGADVTVGTVDAAQLTYDELKNRALAGKILSVDTSGNQPVVKFQVVMADNNQGVRGLRTFALHVAQLKPAVNGSPAYWLNYIADGLPLTAMPAASSAPVNPSTDAVTSFNTDGTVKGQGYKVVDGNDGTYTVTFGANIKANTKVPFDPSLVHRVVVGVRSVAVPGVVGKTPGAYAGPINPLTGAVIAQFTNTNGENLVYDFTPSASGPGTPLAASARDVVNVDACNKCHYKIEYGFPRGNNTSGHFGSRPDTKTCVMCHTPQNTVTTAFPGGAGDFTPFIHKIHMGEELPVKETYPMGSSGFTVGEITYPQDVRACDTCHKGTVVDSWKSPSRKACGACHNNVNFATGTNHVGGAWADDSTCTLCHTKDKIALYHVPIMPPDPASIYAGGTNANTNASYLAAMGVVPAGAPKITYVVSNVKLDANRHPQITFKFQKNGTDVVFNTYSPTGKQELMDGYVGSPSVYFAWSVPQDGIAAPADFNATASSYIKNLWRGDGKDMKGVALTDAAFGTMTGPTSGSYTITLTKVVVPTTAKMLTGGVGYTYSLSATPPLVQIDHPDSKYAYTPNPSTINAGVGGVGGLSVPPGNVWKVADTFTARRGIVDSAKCNTCHGALGVKPTFHAGQRNDAQTCVFCHHVNRTNSGWPVNINYDVHAIHGGSLRTAKFSWEATAGAKYWEIGYPGLLKNCEMCHNAGFYDYTNSGYTSASTADGAWLDRLLMTTAASTTATSPTFPSGTVIITGNETIGSSVISPYAVPGTNYGLVFSFNAVTGVTTEAAATTQVLSPISAACSGCHDSASARTHMQINGGTVFEARSVAAGRKESCLTCHGPANNALFNETVPAIKIVHRWW